MSEVSNSYCYRWNFEVGPGFELEVGIVATNAITAKRQIGRFLDEHAGGEWFIGSVSRARVDSPVAKAASEIAGNARLD